MAVLIFASVKSQSVQLAAKNITLYGDQKSKPISLKCFVAVTTTAGTFCVNIKRSLVCRRKGLSVTAQNSFFFSVFDKTLIKFAVSACDHVEQLVSLAAS